MSADFSDERRAAALSWLRSEGLLDDPNLSHEARLTAAVGLLICDDAGRIKQADLEAAFQDPTILQAAETLLQEAAG
jgi:hypothetical protein